MNRSHTWIALALAIVATAAAGEALTWQEANKRSAALIREKGPSAEAADLAHQAFDLYPQQTKSYNANTHAQLLLNLAAAREQAEGWRAALGEIDRGAEVVAQNAGRKTDVLIAVWQEGARIAGYGAPNAGRYSARALAVAEEILGPEDPRTIQLLLEHVRNRRQEQGYDWTVAKLKGARMRATKVRGEHDPLVAEVDLLLAKAHMDAERLSAGREAFWELIGRLEKTSDPTHEILLQAAYAQLEYSYERRGDLETAKQLSERRAERSLRDPDTLVPTMRVAPEYPHGAARRGVEGFVLLRVDVDPEGGVAGLKILESEPPGMFEAASTAALKKWKFKPKVVDGKTVPSRGTQRIEYRMR